MVSKVQRSTLVYLLVGCVAVLLFAQGISHAISMTFCPFKIVLNATGAAADFQAVLRMSLPAGYSTVSSYDVTLKVNDQEVAEAIGFRYCYIDDNFLASFDRQEVLQSPVIQALANSLATATVEGSYVATNADGEEITVSFSASTTVEIVDPKKKP